MNLPAPMTDHTKNPSDTRNRLHCRERFAACVATADADLDLASAALWLAAEEYPELDPQIYLGRLESLAERVRVAWNRRPGAFAALDALRSVLVEEQNFGGNSHDYFDPRNSFLNEVLDRRVGIPISLSVVWIEVGRRAGIPIEGVNMPGHFIVRLLDRREPLLVDPFCDGMLLTPEACEERLRQVQGNDVRLSAEDLVAASSKQILVRMLDNLRLVYLETEDYGHALSVIDRIVLIVGDTPKLRRDRGLLFARLRIYGKAWADLAAYLGSDEGREGARDSTNEEVSLLREHLERVRYLAAAPN
jgi:regulator of sirC expression with transglutaminase-like and TPR domain